MACLRKSDGFLFGAEALPFLDDETALSLFHTLLARFSASQQQQQQHQSPQRSGLIP